MGVTIIGYNPISLKSINSVNSNQDSFASLENISNKNNYNADSIIVLINQNLYKTTDSISYEDYYNNIIDLSNHPLIEKVELVTNKYSDGSIESIGLKAKHKFTHDKDDIYSGGYYTYKIGTWKYFYKNGQLMMLVDYDLNEIKNGRYIEYDVDGNLKSELKFRSGKRIN